MLQQPLKIRETKKKTKNTRTPIKTSNAQHHKECFNNIASFELRAVFLFFLLGWQPKPTWHLLIIRYSLW